MRKLAVTPALAVAAVAALMLVAIPAGVAQAATTPWLHVRVKDGKSTAETVSVSVPLSLARTALDLALEDGRLVTGGTIRIDSREFTVPELRLLWSELRAAGDAELVAVDDGTARVSVRQQGDRVLVDVLDQGGATVKLEVPAPVVDALLSGQGDELDVEAAVAHLAKAGPRDLVTVSDGDADVRIWVE